MLLVQVKDHIDSLSDATLYQYATDTEGRYADDAVAYAKELLVTRKFDRPQIAALQEIKEQQKQHEAIHQTEAANLPLSGGMRFFFFLLGMGGVPLIMTLIFYERFKERGQKKRVRQMFLTMLAGFMTIIAVAVVIAVVAWTRHLLETRGGPHSLRY